MLLCELPIVKTGKLILTQIGGLVFCLATNSLRSDSWKTMQSQFEECVSSYLSYNTLQYLRSNLYILDLLWDEGKDIRSVCTHITDKSLNKDNVVGFFRDKKGLFSL